MRVRVPEPNTLPTWAPALPSAILGFSNMVFLCRRPGGLGHLALVTVLPVTKPTALRTRRPSSEVVARISPFKTQIL